MTDNRKKKKICSKAGQLNFSLFPTWTEAKKQTKKMRENKNRIFYTIYNCGVSIVAGPPVSLVLPDVCACAFEQQNPL